ncbi:hypothetical protein [Methanobrevibacter sp.]|uniref:hypothetical protein n=1 Tax=Methanobrevibacter sp. TaxID=66852 RepID=UPI00388FB41D
MLVKDLSSYLKEDREKRFAIDNILYPAEYDIYLEEHCDYYLAEAPRPKTKYCPKCFKKYFEKDLYCKDCLCSLKHISEMKRPREIRTNPTFTFKGKRDFESFDEIFTEENFIRIDDFSFSMRDFKKITRIIKRTALENMEEIVKANEIDLESLNVQEKVLLFAKSFVDVDFKSYGPELGHFEFNKITVDDRQTPSLHMTTLIHELSHFLLKEILTGIICRILDCSKNTYIESIALYMLIYSPFTELIDEYAAHTVEGRFTLYGYQDYSSFLNIEQSLDGEMGRDEIEITKSIGNTFSIAIKDILESFIDDDLRLDIKDQFLRDTRDRPNYEMLRLENCEKLTDNGFLKAIWLILSEGFIASSMNVEKLIEYEEKI